ncbi:MAG: hypothetical protein JST11_16940, partial [Acidobacteria bacterium]|nr:hypothetical protein [Acidobacteriota bacterium]
MLIRGAQVALIASAGLAAFLLRFEFSIPPLERSHLLWGIVTWTLVKSAVLQ